MRTMVVHGTKAGYMTIGGEMCAMHQDIAAMIHRGQTTKAMETASSSDRRNQTRSDRDNQYPQRDRQRSGGDIRERPPEDKNDGHSERNNDRRR